MKGAIGLGLAIGLTLVSWSPTPVMADGTKAKARAHHAATTYRDGGPRVRGFVARRGGYSYVPEDVINTYGNSRTLYGSASVYRDPMLDRQTQFGPFDHGFFFDSGIAPRGGDSPYQN